jgi:hypothetical protein
MTWSWSATSTVPVNEQQSAYWAMNLSIFAALSGLSAAKADGICDRRVKRRRRKIKFFTVVLTSRGGLAWSRQIVHPERRQSSQASFREPEFVAWNSKSIAQRTAFGADFRNPSSLP